MVKCNMINIFCFLFLISTGVSFSSSIEFEANGQKFLSSSNPVPIPKRPKGHWHEEFLSDAKKDSSGSNSPDSILEPDPHVSGYLLLWVPEPVSVEDDHSDSGNISSGREEK